MEDSNEKLNKVLLKPEGKTDFDDLTELKEVQTHSIDKFKFAEMQNPSDFFNHTSCIPSARQSAEEEYFFKTAGLDSFTVDSLTSAYTLPIKVPAHHFIYDDQSIKQYQNYTSCDEKDPEVNLENSLPIEDEFEGWTGGEFEILKYKFTRNNGCPYTTFSGFNFSSERHSLPPEATLMQGLPKLIEEPSYEDTIENGDSDEEILEETPVEASLKFLDQIEGNNADLKERRSQNKVQNPERSVH